MTREYKLNPHLSFLEKNNIFALYVDFGFIFLKSISANLFRIIQVDLSEGSKINDSVPESFISFLLEKRIILEVSDEGN